MVHSLFMLISIWKSVHDVLRRDPFLYVQHLGHHVNMFFYRHTTTLQGWLPKAHLQGVVMRQYHHQGDIQSPLHQWICLMTSPQAILVITALLLMRQVKQVNFFTNPRVSYIVCQILECKISFLFFSFFFICEESAIACARLYKRNYVAKILFWQKSSAFIMCPLCSKMYLIWCCRC